MSWGNKILIAILLFIGMMSYLVYRSLTTQYELVSPTYYNEELAYQQIIDGTTRANQLSAPPSIVLEDSFLLIRFPEELKGKPMKGSAHFYCPTDAAKDRIFPLQTDSSGLQRIRSSDLAAGRYIVKLLWETGQLSYYSEQKMELAP
jgi:hypothetical protein